MEFEDKWKSVWHLLVAPLLYAAGLGLFCAPILEVIDGGWQVSAIVLTVVLCVPVGSIVLWIAWQGSLQLKVELSASPREARCRRRNFFTRIATRHRYPIPDDAKVLIHDKAEDSDDPRDNGSWAVTIQGLPRYYDFWYLGHCKTYGDAVKLARQLASFLDIPVTTWDDRKNPNLKRPSQQKAERKHRRAGDHPADHGQKKE
jgi:hypothetical protein